jgi:hypothetical protein
VPQSSLSNFILNMLSSLSPRGEREREQKEKAKNREQQIHKGKIPSANLTDMVVALLHQVASPRHRCHGRHGGRHHRCQAPAPTPSTSTPSNPRFLERPLSPSLDRLTYRSMEPSDHDASPSGRHGHPCVPLMVGARALTRLHRWSGPHHRTMRGRRRVKKTKKN